MSDVSYNDEVLDFLREGERTAVFIDGSNLYVTAAKMQIAIDYKKLLNLFKDNTNLIRAFYYTAITDGRDYDPIRRLIDFLDYNGYTMVTKPLKEFTRNGERHRKGNMDVDLTIDMLRVSPNVDHVILMSGDGDFRKLVEEAQRNCCRVTVISSPNFTADELIRQCDTYVDLWKIRKYITNHDYYNREDREEVAV